MPKQFHTAVVKEKKSDNSHHHDGGGSKSNDGNKTYINYENQLRLLLSKEINQRIQAKKQTNDAVDWYYHKHLRKLISQEADKKAQNVLSNGLLRQKLDKIIISRLKEYTHGMFLNTYWRTVIVVRNRLLFKVFVKRIERTFIVMGSAGGHGGMAVANSIDKGVVKVGRAITALGSAIGGMCAHLGISIIEALTLLGKLFIKMMSTLTRFLSKTLAQKMSAMVAKFKLWHNNKKIAKNVHHIQQNLKSHRSFHYQKFHFPSTNKSNFNLNGIERMINKEQSKVTKNIQINQKRQTQAEINNNQKAKKQIIKHKHDVGIINSKIRRVQKKFQIRLRSSQKQVRHSRKISNYINKFFKNREAKKKHRLQKKVEKKIQRLQVQVKNQNQHRAEKYRRKTPEINARLQHKNAKLIERKLHKNVKQVKKHQHKDAKRAEKKRRYDMKHNVGKRAQAIQQQLKVNQAESKVQQKLNHGIEKQHYYQNQNF